MKGSLLLSAQCRVSANSKRLNPIGCCQSSQILLLYQILVREKSKSTQNISFIGVNCKMFNINLDEKVTNTDKPEYNIGIKFREKRVQQKEINNKKEEDNNDIED